MNFVASSGKTATVTVRVPLWRVRRVYAPAGAIHACAEGEFTAACGVPMGMLIAWPEYDFATHEFPHGCPNCAVALARTKSAAEVEATDFFIPVARRGMDELSADAV
jgi:hypothetical protein